MDVYNWMNSMKLMELTQQLRGIKDEKEQKAFKASRLALRDIQWHVRLSQARGTYPTLRTPMFRLRPPRWRGELMEGETTVGE